ncbi:MAG: rhamnan synthesis F family protein, partial [Treponema sp.]|nr:rhamnan synthesis F family protein [Treponema sp.]
MNRTLYFVHYNKLNGLAEYVIYLLKNIRAVYGRIVFVSNSPLCEEQRNRILEFSDEILVRENRGFDFGAWKDALLKDGWENISRYDSITLMNDSCFGPLFDIENMYLDMEQKDIDFWGLTNHRNDKHGMPGTNRPIPEHIQSYFICFNRKTAESEAFKRFWRNMKNENNIEKVIQNYETRLTGILTGAGYKYSVLLDAYNFA